MHIFAALHIQEWFQCSSASVASLFRLLFPPKSINPLADLDRFIQRPDCQCTLQALSHCVRSMFPIHFVILESRIYDLMWYCSWALRTPRMMPAQMASNTQLVCHLWVHSRATRLNYKLFSSKGKHVIPLKIAGSYSSSVNIIGNYTSW